MKPLSCICSLTALVALTWVYIVAFHRIRTPAEMINVLDLSVRPSIANGRCKLINGSHAQCLANVFFIGASKAGTTALADLLARHPAVHFTERRVPPTIFNNEVLQKHGRRGQKHREIHRFDRSAFGSTSELLELLDEFSCSPVFPLQALGALPGAGASGDVGAGAGAGVGRVPDPTPVVVHYTPQYLYAPTVPFELRRMYERASVQEVQQEQGLGLGSEDQRQRQQVHPPRSLADELVFVVMLREPIARALSSYWFKNSHLFDARGADRGSLRQFAEALPAELRWRQAHEACMHHRFYRHFNDSLDIAVRGRALARTGDPERGDGAYLTALQRCFALNISSDESGSRLHARSKLLGLQHASKGVYHDQLLRWFHQFPPRPRAFGSGGGRTSTSTGTNAPTSHGNSNGNNRYCVVLLERFSVDPVGQYARLLRCIGVDTTSEESVAALRQLETDQASLPNRLRSPNSRAQAQVQEEAQAQTEAQAPVRSPCGTVPATTLGDNFTSYNELLGPGLDGTSGAVGCEADSDPNRELTQIRMQLASFYRPHNDRLARLLEAIDVDLQ